MPNTVTNIQVLQWELDENGDLKAIKIMAGGKVSQLGTFDEDE